MGSSPLDELKKQASFFLQEKYRTARLTFTDVTQAELLAEEATNGDPCGPDAKTMTKIAEAAYDIDDYWRIVDVLHRRLYLLDWKEWRQLYKALVLLEFLLTHGPESIAEEFQCDEEAIEELGKFQLVDERGFDWGAAMQKKSERILQLIFQVQVLKGERFKALRITKEIQGFGNPLTSPSSSLSSSLSSPSQNSSNSSFASPTWTDSDDQQRPVEELVENSRMGAMGRSASKKSSDRNAGSMHLWDTPIKETGSLLDDSHEDEKEIRAAVVEEGKSWFEKPGEGKVGLRSLSNVGKVIMKKLDRQWSLGF